VLINNEASNLHKYAFPCSQTKSWGCLCSFWWWAAFLPALFHHSSRRVCHQSGTQGLHIQYSSQQTATMSTEPISKKGWLPREQWPIWLPRVGKQRGWHLSDTGQPISIPAACPSHS